MPGRSVAPARPCAGGPRPGRTVTDVVVLGGGALGAATAWWLARAGAAVVLLEERTAREVRREVRGTAWSAHPGWTAAGARGSLPDAVRAWWGVERETGSSLVARMDALDHGGPADLPGERLRAGALAARWPGTTLTGPVVVRPGAAVQVRADLAVAALTAAAVGAGAVVRHRSAAGAVEVLDERCVEVTTGEGPVRARRAVVTGTAPGAGVGAGVELHLGLRGDRGPAMPLIAHHDPELGLVRVAPCAQGHLAVGAGPGPRDLTSDLRDRVRSWFPDADGGPPEPVAPGAASTGSADVAVDGDGPVVTAASAALGSVLVVLHARELAERVLAGPAGALARA